MTIAEPATLITDYLLGGFSLYWGIPLYKSIKAKWWGVAFFAVAASAFIGGTYHGFPQFHPHELWAATMFCAGVASFAMVVATGQATGIAPTFFFWFALLKFMAYVAVTSRHDEFLYVVIDSGIGLLLVALLHAIRGDPPWRWMIAAVAVSVAAAGVQAMRLAPHPHFNHNDLYHVIQIAAMWLFYRGARLIHSGTEP